MEKQESKNRFPTFPQPRRLRSTFSYGIRILGARPYIGDFLRQQLRGEHGRASFDDPLCGEY